MNFHDMEYGDLIKHVEESIRALRLRAYKEGYEQGRFDERIKWSVSEQYQQQRRRDEIVEQAKRDVESLKNEYQLSEKEVAFSMYKREVRAYITHMFSGKELTRGIAKCAPNDCFNVHIGKAIALRRALGLEVPDEYLNAPQPTEVRVGDIVKSKRTGRVCKVIRFCEDEIRDTTWGRPFYTDGVVGWLGTEQVNIIDDSRDDEEV